MIDFAYDIVKPFGKVLKSLKLPVLDMFYYFDPINFVHAIKIKMGDSFLITLYVDEYEYSTIKQPDILIHTLTHEFCELYKEVYGGKGNH